MDINRSEVKIYLLAGKARSGKDEVARIINKLMTSQNKRTINLQYSTYIKKYAMNIIGWDGNDDNKPRAFLQYLGTDIIRKKIDELFFVKRMCDDIKVYSNFFEIITISDTRFKVEIEIPKKVFGNVTSILITRPNNLSGLTEKELKHDTEIDLDGYNNYDYIITNDGDLNDLEDKVKKIIMEG